MLNSFFHLEERKSSFVREVFGGAVTFMTMAYIISVQPFLMSQIAPNWVEIGGDVYFSLMVSTCLVAALGSLIMALHANLPVALAPGMGINVMFATMIGSVAATPQIALGVIFWSGLIFIFLSFFRLREFILKLIKPSQQSAIVVGIGLFILTLGVLNAFKVPGSYDLLKWQFSFIWDGTVFLVFIINLVILAVLIFLRVPGALLFGMLIGAVIAGFFGIVKIDQVVGAVPSISPTLFQIDFLGALSWGLLPYIAIFLYVDMFETMATLIGVTRRAGMVSEDGNIPNARKALRADAIATMSGSLVGVSPVTSYIESSAGVVTGARTGLASVVTAILFILAIFFTPLWSNLAANVVVGPALIIVGFYMVSEARKIGWRDWTEAVPATAIMLAMVAFLSIADGLAAGFILYPVCKLAGGRKEGLNWLSWTMAAVSIFVLVMRHVSF